MAEENAPEPIVPDPAEIAEAARVKLAESHDDELEKRLMQIEQTAAKGQAHFRKAQPKPEEGGPSTGMSPEQGRNLGVGLSIAYAILGAPLVFFGLGFLIDQATHGVFWRGALGLLGCCLGVAYAMIVANRSANS